MTRTITLSVGQLIAFACRSGDLAAGPRGPTALEGIRAHQRWQRQRSADSRTEVSVSSNVSINSPTQGHWEVTLQGRIDVLCETGPSPLIEEIKSCYCAPEQLSTAQKSLQWAQLKVYGFLYLNNAAAMSGSRETNDGSPLRHAASTSEPQPTRSPSLLLRMTWLRLPLDEPHHEQCTADWHELQQFTTEAIQRYVHWQHLVDQQRSACQGTAQQLTFPYPAFRGGQRTMATQVYRTLRDGKTALCEAPTGIGKTISALFPAVKAVGTEHIDQIIYLTAKNSGRQSATAALQAMIGEGLDITYLVVQAKQSACSCRNGDCERDEQGLCPRCPGFFDRLPPAREALLALRTMDSATIDRVASRFQLCPFELCLQMLPWSTVVICDYNYAFDPLTALSWSADNSTKVGILLDEAHNLIDRARQMYSATLTRQQLRHWVALSTAEHPSLAKKLQAIERAMTRWHQQCAKASEQAATGARVQQEEYLSQALPATVLKAVQRCGEVQANLPADTPPYPAELADGLRDVYRFGAIAEYAGPHHHTISRCQQRGRRRQIEIKLQCLNAADYLAEHYKKFHALALFSATLSPQAYYRQALGLDEHCTMLALPSPFAPQQQATVVCSAIDTRYQQRQAAIPGIVDIIECVLRSKRGNYLLFFASYHFMRQVADALSARYPTLAIQIQQRDASEQQRAAFVNNFTSDSTLLGFAIMGGVFGEGVDYPGDKLLGAIIVGTGLPALGTEQELIRQDYAASGLDGFDFAYRFPGLSRVLQAAGRVIRSEHDRGVVILVDQRFAAPAYRTLLPRHWLPQYCNNTSQVEHALGAFWHQHADHPTGAD